MKNGQNASRDVPPFDDWTRKVASGASVWWRRGGKAQRDWGMMPLVQVLAFVKNESADAFEVYQRAGIDFLLLCIGKGFHFKLQ